MITRELVVRNSFGAREHRRFGAKWDQGRRRAKNGKEIISVVVDGTYSEQQQKILQSLRIGHGVTPPIYAPKVRILSSSENRTKKSEF